jgi:hypothetical protein
LEFKQLFSHLVTFFLVTQSDFHCGNVALPRNVVNSYSPFVILYVSLPLFPPPSPSSPLLGILSN